MKSFRFKSGSYSGYVTRPSISSDDELTRVGPKTPCGEYLRRYWHPVSLAGELGERPLALRILGEDLVLFRDRSDQLGLVHRHCPHRGSSLEFGRCEERGIRCCYHGWHFDVDGTLLDAPGQPAGLIERLKHKIQLGAYPVLEYKDLIFAYLGPVEEMPEFPVSL